MRGAVRRLLIGYFTPLSGEALLPPRPRGNPGASGLSPGLSQHFQYRRRSLPQPPLSAGVSIPFLYSLYFGMTNSLFPLLLLFRKARPFIAALFQREARADERERESERALAVKFPGGVIPCQDRRGRDINSPISPLGNTMGAKNKQSSISPLFSSLLEASVLTHYNCN